MAVSLRKKSHPIPNPERKTMTPEQQRIAIAESCGWTECVNNPARGRGLLGLPPQSSFLGLTSVPDYLNDLNDMHEAEKVLTADQWYKYDRLMPLRDPQKIHSPAAQRAEAFLRTIGKWTANPNEL